MTQFLVPAAIASEARSIVGSTTWQSGSGDGILHSAITQPAGIAPVQASLPGLKQLIKRSYNSALLLTGLLSMVEVQVVPASRWGVWEHNT